MTFDKLKSRDGKQEKMSEPRLSGFGDDQDLAAQKILKTSNQVNPDSDNRKQGWEIKKLGEVCKVIAGQSPEGKFYNSEGNGMPFYQGKKEYGEKYIGEPTTWTTKITKEAEAGDILMSVRAPVGPVNFATQKICIGRGLAALRVGKSIDKEFLYNFLIKHENEIEGNAGAVFNSINKTQIENIEIPLPPLPEQQRIVSILDEAFAAIERSRNAAVKNLKNAKELFESYLQGVFENGNNDWEVKCLGQLGTITSSKRIYKSEYVKDGVPFYRTKEIKELSNGKPVTLELFISRDRYEQIKKSFGVPQIGDLLMSAVGTIGEIMVIENEDEFYFKDGNIVWFKDFQRLDTNYLKYALTAFVEKIKSLAIGAAYSALTIEKLNKYEIAFPKTKEDQQTIVRQLDALRAETQKLEAVYQKKIANLDELKKSILQLALSPVEGKAFSGELKSEKVIKV